MISRSLPVLLLLPVFAFAQTHSVTGGKHDATNVVVRTKDSPATFAVVIGEVSALAQDSDGEKVFVIPKLRAGETIQLKKPDFKLDPPIPFEFKEEKGEYVDVMYGKRPVLRFVNKPRDANDHYLTFKPFHQVFDPKEGKTLLSSGAHPNVPEFKFPHHRGLFFGFNKISYEQNGKKLDADIWHGTKDVFSTADKMVGTEAGPVFAKHTAAISWHGPDSNTFADELRTVTVYNVPNGTMLDWSTELSTKLDKVRLDGDPQHAGFHFRATQEVSKETAKKTYYLRPDGKGKEGETRNWDAKGKDPKTVNLPWNAMSFETGGKRYTALRISHPDNPKETRGSERDYGRFGDYFEFDLTPKTPLKLKYRVWVQEGEITVEQCEAMAHGFTDAVAVKAGK
jgi:Methane oxygenase PmoA